jgi:hypothetical protein
MAMMFPGRKDGPKCPMCGHTLKKGGHRLWGRVVIWCPECGFIDEEGVGQFDE